MKIKLPLSNLFVWIVAISTLLSCSPLNATPTMMPEDIPISEFISRINTDNGEPLEINFPTVRISNKEISYGDTYRAEYNFIQEDMIFVNNLRLTGGETWRLERDNGNLIVYQEYQGYKSTLILERDTR